MWRPRFPPPSMKETLQFDLAHLFSLQNQLRNFKMHLQMNPIASEVNSAPSTHKVSLATHSVYDRSKINQWTPGDDEEDKPDLPYIYNPCKFPVTISNSTTDNNNTDRNAMMAHLQKLMKTESERLINNTTKLFYETYLQCRVCEQAHRKCMTPAITTMYANLHIEVRQADPSRVTQWMADNWLRTFEKMRNAQQRGFAETGGEARG